MTAKTIFLTDVPDNLLDKRVLRNHFSQFGTVLRVSLDIESECCSICFQTSEEANRAYEQGVIIGNHQLNIMIGPTGQSTVRQTEQPRDAHSYEDLDMNYLNDNNDVFAEELPDIDEEFKNMHSENDLLKMKKKIIRELHKERKDKPKDAIKNVRKVSMKGTKTIKRTSKAKMTANEMSDLKDQRRKFQMLEIRDKLYREKLKAKKLNLKFGICPDMCPERERYMRKVKKLWSVYEERSGTFAPELAVKEYSRSSADQEEPLPHEMRPEPVLTITMTHLVLNIMPSIEISNVNVSEWYDFLWDRLRGIRKDIVQQQLCSVNTAYIIEQCARYHIVCFDRLCGQDASVFDEKINTENLNSCLQSLLNMYDDLAGLGYSCPNEPEFRAYEILLKLNRGDILWEFQQLSPELQTAPEILFALKVFAAFNNNMYSSFFTLLKETSYLNACLMQRYLGIVRSGTLKTVITAFCRPQDQSFKVSPKSIKKMLKFDQDNDTLDFCCAHGMELTEDGDLTIGKYDFSVPTNLASYLSSSLTIVKAKRLSLPITVMGSENLPEKINHNIHDSFDAYGELNTKACNVTDQIEKLKTDFNFVVEHIPIIEVDENMLKLVSKAFREKKVDSIRASDVLKASLANIKPKSFSPTKSSKEIHQDFIEDDMTIKSNLFPKDPRIMQEEGNLPNTSSILKKSEENMFKKPFPVSNSFAKTPSLEKNVFSKASTDLSNPFAKASSLDKNIFSKASSDLNPFKKPSGESKGLFSKSDTSNLFAKIVSELKPIPDIINKPSSLFQNPIPNSTNSSLFPTPLSDHDTPGKIFMPKLNNQAPQQPVPSNFLSLFKDKSSGEPSNASIFQTNKATTNTSLFRTNEKPSNMFLFGSNDETSNTNLFRTNDESSNMSMFSSNFPNSSDSKPSSFSEFMNNSDSKNSSSGCFNFLQKHAEIESTEEKPSSTCLFGKISNNTGFEKSYETFLKESEEASRKRTADDVRESERQKEVEAIRKEKEKQRLVDLENERLKNIEAQKQQEAELRRQLAIEIERKKQLEVQRQRELELIREQELERIRLEEIELEKQRQWEHKLKEDVLTMKVNFDLSIILEDLEKKQEKSLKENEVRVMQMKKEKEMRKLRKIVRKKLKYIRVKNCLKKWKDRVEKLKLNKLDFPQVVLSSIENHTVVWGSLKNVHTPYVMKERFLNLKKIHETSVLSCSNLYLGLELIRIMNNDQVKPKFIKLNCSFSTPLTWKVSFHLPKLSHEYDDWKTNLKLFLNQLCYDKKSGLGITECLKTKTQTLYNNYNLFIDYSYDPIIFLGTNLYLFVISELWETLEESVERFKFSTHKMNSDIKIVIVCYRSDYKKNVILDQFQHVDQSINFIVWNSAQDMHDILVEQFKQHVTNHEEPPLYYENMYDILFNEIEYLFLQLKLDSDFSVCHKDLVANFKNPNFFITIYNTFLSKLIDIIESNSNINIAPEFSSYLLKDKDSVIINKSKNLNNILQTLFLPRFKNWPVQKISKLKKLLKQFCSHIDKSETNELFMMVMRLLNPPSDNVEHYVSQVKWNKIFIHCFLWNIRSHFSNLKNIYVFYDKNVFDDVLHSHWWNQCLH